VTPDERRSIERVEISDWVAAYAPKGLMAIFVRPKVQGSYPVIDIHHSGMQMLTEEALERGQKLVLCLKSSDGEELLVDGEVAWVVPAESGEGNGVGICFTEHYGDSLTRLKEIAGQG